MTAFESNATSAHKNGGRNQHMKKGNVLLAAVGIALLVSVIVHAGPSAIVHQLKVLRVALPIVVALSLARLFLRRPWATSPYSGLFFPSP